MTTWTITNKSTGEALHAYTSDSPIEWVGYEFATHAHTAQHDDAADRDADGGITWTKLAYLRRFTQVERIAIRAAAKVSAQLDDYLALLELASEVKSNDPDIIAALTMLEASGLLAAGRADEILHIPTQANSVVLCADWLVTHSVTKDGITQDAGISTDDIVRLPEGKWSTVAALTSLGATFVKV